jgi:hypothetical protein
MTPDTPTDDAGTPTIAIAFYVVGAIIIAVCVIGMLRAIVSSSSTDIGTYLGGMIGGLLLLGAGFALMYLHRIEFHLRRRP